MLRRSKRYTFILRINKANHCFIYISKDNKKISERILKLNISRNLEYSHILYKCIQNELNNVQLYLNVV